MARIIPRLALAALLLGPLAAPASAALVTFAGADLGAGPGAAHPTSSAAAASFDAAAATIGSASVITFESAPLGSFHNLTVAPSVSITGADVNNADQTIRNTSNFPPAPSLDGFNTTSGGANFVEMIGGNLVFTFAQPTQFFGAYLTGVQTAFFADTVTFNDGTTESIAVPGSGTSSSIGEVAFVGFTDAGRSITSITINAGIPGNPNAGYDAIGVDDVRYQVASSVAVPEPASITLCGMAALLGWAAARVRRVRAR